MATRPEIYQRALERVNACAAGEAASGTDTLLATQEYASLYARLQNEKLVTWGAASDIPVWAESPMTTLLAHAMRNEFSVPLDRIQVLNGDAQAALVTIRKQLENDEQTSPAPVCFF